MKKGAAQGVCEAGFWKRQMDKIVGVAGPVFSSLFAALCCLRLPLCYQSPQRSGSAF
jgi:hypothetical protein